MDVVDFHENKVREQMAMAISSESITLRNFERNAYNVVGNTE